MDEENHEVNNKRIVIYKLSCIQNDMRIIKDTFYTMKMEMEEMKKVVQELILVRDKDTEKNYWFYK